VTRTRPASTSEVPTQPADLVRRYRSACHPHDSRRNSVSSRTRSKEHSSISVILADQCSHKVLNVIFVATEAATAWSLTGSTGNRFL